MVRTRDPQRFGRALALHLSGHGAPSDGLLRTGGIVAVRDDRATVLPISLRQQIPAYERPLRDAGVILHDAPWVDLDPYTCEIVVGPPALAAMDFNEVTHRLPPPPRPDPVVEAGRYPVTCWYFTEAGSGEQHMAESEAVATLLSMLRSRLVDEEQLSAVAAMYERTPFGRLPLRTPGELIEQLRS